MPAVKANELAEGAQARVFAWPVGVAPASPPTASSEAC